MSDCVPGTREKYPDLVEPVRARLKISGVPYIIENVIGAPLLNPVMLCGTSFGLRIRHHRLFETNFRIAPLDCKHNGYVFNPHAVGGRARIRAEFPGQAVEKVWAREKGVGWMNCGHGRKGHEAREAVPPAYTEYIGRQLMAHLESVRLDEVA